MQIKEIEISELKPAKYNPRFINPDKFKGLKHSLKVFDLVRPIVVNKDMTIISGHKRIEALIDLGNKTAPCNVVDLDEVSEKKLNIILNSDAIQGSFDEIKLSEILESIKLDADYIPLRFSKLELLDLSMINMADEDSKWVGDHLQKDDNKSFSLKIIFDNQENLKEFIKDKKLLITKSQRSTFYVKQNET